MEEIRKDLNERFRELEEELFEKVLKITNHLRQSIANGMVEYRNFDIDGQIYIEPDDDVPDDVMDRFMDLQRREYSVAFASEDKDDQWYYDFWEHTRKFDFKYFDHPENYPEDYSPLTRAYENILIDALIHDRLKESDLMYIKPGNINSNIVIHI